MQNIQLYIEGERVDMFKDESVSITQSIQNVKDISKVFADYSKTFNIPASATNNKIFKHYYNFDINNGFDARKRVDANIDLNSMRFRDGRIKLEGVNLKNNKPHTYKITFFGSVVALSDLLGDDKLSSLSSLSDYNKIYSPTEIRNSLQSDPDTNDLIVPLISHTRQLLYDTESGHVHDDLYLGNMFYEAEPAHRHGVWYNDLKYALRVDAIIKAIETKYSISFSGDFFNSTNKPYYNVFMWLHRKKGYVENLGDANQSIVSGWIPTSYDFDTETQMKTTSVFTIGGYIDFYNSVNLNLTTTSTASYKVAIFTNGIEVYKSPSVIGGFSINTLGFISEGDHTVYIESTSSILFSSITWNGSYEEPNSLPRGFSYINSSYQFVSQFTFDILQQIPEIKVIDFLTGIFKTFNLTAYLERNNTDIIVKTLNDFYASGISYDISEYVDVEKSEVNVALPYKEMNFEHEDIGTILALTHSEKFGKKWGREEYTSGEKLDGGTYDVKTPFSHMQFERIVDIFTGTQQKAQVGWSVDQSRDAAIGKPLLFYPVRITGDTVGISFVNSESSHQRLQTYINASNSLYLDPNLGTDNLNFFAETNEYTGASGFTDTLFSKYYKTYIQGIFNTRNRITKVSSFLPLRILLNYNLSDRFVIGNNSYKINTITTNFQTGKSELELLNDLW